MTRKIGQMAVFNDFLSKNNRRKTEQRDGILRALIKVGRHVSADDLYTVLKDSAPTIGYATVFRNLKLLCESGLVQETKVGNSKSLYEAKKYGADHHDHLICLKCGVFEEFFSEEMETLQEEIARRMGFQIRRHRMEIYGLCKKCQTTEE